MIGVQLNDMGFTLSPDGEQLVTSTLLPPGANRAHEIQQALSAAGWLDSPCCVAVAANETREKLGELLADCIAERVPVVGFLDSAVLTAGATGLAGVGVVLELQKYSAVATRVVETSGSYRRAAMLQGQACGWGDLRRACLQQIADTMIRQTRFDPLHEAKDEHYLEDHLQVWLQEVMATGEVQVKLTALGKALDVTLTVDDFTKATEPVLRRLRSVLRDLYLPGVEQYVLIADSILSFPGMQAMLSGFGRLPIFSVADGVAARAAATFDTTEFKDHEVVLRRQASVPKLSEPRRLLVSESSHYRPPSHVLYENRVWSLATPISIGRSGDSVIPVSSGVPGVSRHHCTVLRESGECVIIDHSRYGTWLNEEPVRGRQRLAAGDRIRLGDPGIELSLITVSDEHGQASR